MPIIILIALIASNLAFTPAITYYYSATEIKKEIQIENLPELAQKIIWCESQNNPNARNVNKNGTIDYGLMQVNSVHIPAMEKLGLDIENPEDNLQYGLLLLSKNGLQPWKSSKSCWGQF